MERVDGHDVIVPELGERPRLLEELPGDLQDDEPIGELALAGQIDLAVRAPSQHGEQAKAEEVAPDHGPSVGGGPGGERLADDHRGPRMRPGDSRGIPDGDVGGDRRPASPAAERGGGVSRGPRPGIRPRRVLDRGRTFGEAIPRRLPAEVGPFRDVDAEAAFVFRRRGMLI